MGYLQNRNQTLDSSGPEETHWESSTQLLPAEVDTIIALGVLTFALQLCLALVFLIRCWRLDNEVREALKQNHFKPKLFAAPLLHQDIHRPSKPPDSASSVSSVLCEPLSIKNSLLRPSIHWDLVQS